jgi:hypothetical protein
MNEIKRTEYRKGLVASPPMTISAAVQTSPDNIMADLRADARTRYIAILSDLRYLAKYYDLQAVFDQLRQDLGLQ